VALCVSAGGWVACGGDEEAAPTVATPVAPPALATPDRTKGRTTPERRRTARPAPRASAGILSAADRASFRRLEASLGGKLGLAVSGLGSDVDVERLGALRSGAAWSTAKVPVAMAVIAAGGGQAQRPDLSRAIGASDNAAAERLWASLGGGQEAAAAADEQLRAAGDRHTTIEYRRLRDGYTPFGQTAWALSDQARFTAGLACVDAGKEVLGLMNEVVPGQRWGLGSAGVPAQLKGGWGPGTRPGAGGGYLDRQMGVLQIDGKPLAVALATLPADGSHGTGTGNLTAIARWVVAHAGVRTVGARPRC
jgi:hypothetical protein